MNNTNIGWTDYSSSLVKYRDKNTKKVVWACVKASPGCVNCYAESLALRWGKGKPFTAPNIDGVEPFLDTDELKTLLNPKKLPPGKRVFIEDMSDLFGAWVPNTFIDELLAVLAIRNDVTFQLLTKRADRMAAYFGDRGLGLRIGAKLMNAARGNLGAEIATVNIAHRLSAGLAPGGLPNLLLGFSAENQEWFDKRAVQAAPLMRAGWNVWASFEPLLGPITVRSWNGNLQRNWLGENGLKWAVVGGESGRGHRPCEVEWIAGLALEFHDTNTPLFVKQDSGQYPGKQGRIPLPIWETKQHPQAEIASV